MPAAFTAADIIRIAQLARLQLTDDEQALFARQLSEILAFAEQIREVDTRDVPPTSHPTESAPHVLREDHVAGSLARDTVLAQAPDAELDAGLFKVPRVLG